MLGMTHLRQVPLPIVNEPGKSVVRSFSVYYLTSPKKVNSVVFMFRESENIRRLQCVPFLYFVHLAQKRDKIIPSRRSFEKRAWCSMFLTSVKKQGHSRRSIVHEYGATNSKLNDVYSCVLTSTKPHEERSEPFSFFKPEHEKVKTMLELDFMFAFGTKPLTKPKNPISYFC